VQRRRDVAIGGAFPLMLSVGIALFMSRFAPHPVDIGTKLIIGAVSVTPLTAFDVSWYRLVLLDENVSWRSVFKWSDVHTVFVGWNVATSAALALPSLVGPSWLDGLCSPFVLYVVGRASFILPAAASREPVLLPLAWARSMHNGWRLALLDLMVLLSTFVVLLPVAAIGHFVRVPTALSIQLFSVLFVPFRASATALAFRALVDFEVAGSSRAAPN
jgi:hypothetical protein